MSLHFFRSWKDFLLPPRCGCCRESVGEGGALCSSCWKELEFLHPPWCSCCGEPFTFDVPGSVLCEKCVAQSPQERVLDRVRSVSAYKGTARTLVLKLKHTDATYLAPFMGTLMQKTAKEFGKVDYIVPVPLHWTRLFRRQYNQSALLAYYLSEVMQCPCVPSLLKRSRATPSQEGRNAQERRDNVQNAFSIPSQWKKRLPGKTVLLIDDVWTTGATCEACACVLKKFQASQVYVLVFSRASRKKKIFSKQEEGF